MNPGRGNSKLEEITNFIEGQGIEKFNSLRFPGQTSISSITDLKTS